MTADQAQPLTVYHRQEWPIGRFALHDRRHVCHANALRLALEHPTDLILVKGYALTPDGVAWVGHWWCVDRDGGVVDPTWANLGLAYVGVAEVDPVTLFESRAFLRDLGVEKVAPPVLLPALEQAMEAESSAVAERV